MKKYFVLLIVILQGHVLFSQIAWCPPEAEWYYDGQGTFGPYTYIHTYYAGDTIIEGKTCQILQKDYYYRLMNGEINSVQLEKSITYFEDSTVFLRNNTNFDTLYCFNGLPGDSWILRCFENSGICTQDAIVTILDSFTKEINGVQLRCIVLEYYFGAPFATGDIIIVNDTILERMGSINSYFKPWDILNEYLDAQEGGPFRCYSDNTIGNYQPYEKPCDYIYSVGSSVVSANKLNPFPNPCEDRFSIDIESEISVQLELIDITGRTVLQQNNLTSAITIDISNVPDGFYYVLIKQRSATHVKKILKQEK